jgi:hypothetical protein
MIDNNCGVLFHAYRSLENDIVILQRVAEFLDPRDALRCELVCKIFFEVLYQNKEIWAQLSVNAGIPLVDGLNHNRKEDFKILYPITLSASRISRFLGTPVGPIPCISEAAFDMLNKPDPFEEGKLMKDTWVFVVDPAQLKRIAGPEMPFDVDDKKNLVKVPADQVPNGKELVFSCSLKNIKLICDTLKGRENMPVFEGSYDEVFDQCAASSDKTSVYFMRRCIVEKSRNLDYTRQEQLVKQYGFGVTPIRIRALFHTIVILESGTCPDTNRLRYTYARCPDIVHIGNNGHHVVIGGFAPDSGVRVLYFSDCDNDRIGVAPGVPAEVLGQLGLGSSLALDKSH